MKSRGGVEMRRNGTVVKEQRAQRPEASVQGLKLCRKMGKEGQPGLGWGVRLPEWQWEPLRALHSSWAGLECAHGFSGLNPSSGFHAHGASPGLTLRANRCLSTLEGAARQG